MYAMRCLIFLRLLLDGHGMALAVLMPAWCKYVMIKHPEDIAGFAKNVWNVENAGKDV